MSKPPKWVRRYTRRLLWAWGLAALMDDLRIDWAQTVNDNPDAIGHAYSEPRYRRASITLRNDLRNNRQGRQTVRHEIAHLVQMRLSEAMDRILDLTPADQHDHALRLWKDGNEAVVSLLAGAKLRKRKGRNT